MPKDNPKSRAPLLGTGDKIGTATSYSMPISAQNGAPWVRVETWNETTIRKGETRKDAAKRSDKEASVRMTRIIGRLVREAREAQG